MAGTNTTRGAPPPMAAGGTTGQVLTKKTDANYDTEWTTVSGGGGGTVTDVTASAPLSSTGGATPDISIGGGTAGQVLTSNGASAPTFEDLPAPPTVPSASSSNGTSIGTAAPGVSTDYARADHVHDGSLGDLDDVSATAPTLGQVLTWSGSEWAPATPASGGGAVFAGALTVYVDGTNGTDAPGGGTLSAPYQTINYAYSQVPSLGNPSNVTYNAQVGQYITEKLVIKLAPGRYVEEVVLGFKRARVQLIGNGVQIIGNVKLSAVRADFPAASLEALKASFPAPWTGASAQMTFEVVGEAGNGVEADASADAFIITGSNTLAFEESAFAGSGLGANWDANYGQFYFYANKAAVIGGMLIATSYTVPTTNGLPTAVIEIDSCTIGEASNTVRSYLGAVPYAYVSSPLTWAKGTGQATGTQSGTTLQDTTKTWTVNEYAGATVTLTGGTGSGQTATVLSNTANTLTISTTWATTPVANSTTYSLIGVALKAPTGTITLKAHNSTIGAAIGPRLVIGEIDGCRIYDIDRTMLGTVDNGAVTGSTSTSYIGMVINQFRVYSGTGIPASRYRIGAATGTTRYKLDATSYTTLAFSRSGTGVLTARTLDVGGGVSFDFLDDARSLAFTPTTAGNWSPAPATVGAGLDTLAANTLKSANNLSDLTNTTTARTNLGLGTAATQASTAFQPADATLTALAGVSTAADKLAYFTAVDTAAATDITTAGREILSTATSGAAGQVLTSSGGGAPTWTTVSGGGGGGGAVDVQAYTADATWTKPAGAQFVEVIAVGGGGGGGSGRLGQTGSTRGGGGGGGGGGVTRWMVPAAALGATVAVTVGQGGAGGASPTVWTSPANGTSGNPGADGTASTFGSHVYAAGGLAGQGGAGLTIIPGGAGATAAILAGGSGGSGGAGATSNPTAGAQGLGAGGGGGGGGMTSGNTQQAGQAGGAGSPILAGATALPGGTGGAIAGGAGGAGTSVTSSQAVGGGGGGGGGGNHSGTGSAIGGAGGAGGSYGAGGGGGGGGTSLSGVVSSAGVGGAGANGIVYVITY